MHVIFIRVTKGVILNINDLYNHKNEINGIFFGILSFFYEWFASTVNKLELPGCISYTLFQIGLLISLL